MLSSIVGPWPDGPELEEVSEFFILPTPDARSEWAKSQLLDYLASCFPRFSFKLLDQVSGLGDYGAFPYMGKVGGEACKMHRWPDPAVLAAISQAVLEFRPSAALN